MSTNETPCYGLHWDISASECAGCFVRGKCERLTKMRQSGKMPPSSVTETVEEPVVPVEETEELSPLEHLLQSLMGKFDRKDRIGDKAVGHFFSDKGKDKVLVTVSKETNRVRIQAKDYERIFDGIESIEKAEEILTAVA